MALTAKLISFFAFVFAGVWLVYAPGFDSGFTVVASLAAFISSLFLGRKGVQSHQTQNVSGNANATQAGRDVHVNQQRED